MSRPSSNLTEAIRVAVMARDGHASGDEIRFLCPIHEDDGNPHTPSASWNSTKGAWFCQVCREGGSNFDLAQRLGLAKQDHDEWTPRGAAVAVYSYTDEAGDLLFQVCRTADKQFLARKPDTAKRSGWAWNRKGVRSVVYRLPRVQEAIERDATIFIPEGERDVDAIEATGSCATCNPGGAGKWRPKFSEQLAGAKRVMVIADKDAPGRRHAKQIVEALTPVVGQVRIVEAASGKDATDHLAAGHSIDDFVPVDLDALDAADCDGDDAHDGDDTDSSPQSSSSGGPSAATRLVDLAIDAGVDFFHDPYDRVFAVMAVDTHRETRPLRAKHFKGWLAREFYKSERKAASSQALHDALATLEGIAIHEGSCVRVAVRWAKHDGDIYLDLGRPEWDAIRITKDGWELITESPVRFWRPTGFGAMPLPRYGGSWDTLWSLLNLREEECVLFQACVAAAARPDGPYIVLVVQGPQGAAKTTLARVLGRLVDPNEVPVRTFPRDERDLLIAAQKRSLLIYDNLSRLSDDMADAICRLATGGGLSKRQLFTDDDEIVFGAMRPVVLTSIADLATRADVLDRAVLLNLVALSDDARRPEDEFWRDFENAWPQLLGLVLDAASAGLRNVDAVRLERYPRMADFARWVSAAESTFDVPAGTFLAAYNENRAFGHELGLEASILAPVVRDFARREQQWTGTATELLGELEGQVETATVKRKAWPKTASHLSTELRRLEPGLRAVGIDIEFARSGTGRQIRLKAQNAVIAVTGVIPPTNSGFSGDGDGDGGDGASESPSQQQAAPEAGNDGGDGDDGDSRTQSCATVVREHVA